MNARLRSLAYGAAVFFMVFMVGWVAQNTWRELRQLHRGFSSAQAGDFYFPEYIETTVRRLDEIVVRAALHHDAIDEAAFQEGSRDLDRWIRAHQDTLTTPEQRTMMKQVGDEFETYIFRSNEMMSSGGRLAVAPSQAVLMEMVQSNSLSLFATCDRLQNSEHLEQIQFMQDSEEALAWIQELLVLVLAMLAVLVIIGVVVIYTGVIGPLRIELVKSRALAMRNEKLASLGTLAAGVAHEIRNPLTAINVRLHSLKKSLAQNPSAQEDALVIGSEIQRLEGIVQNFLQFARPAEPKLIVVSADSLIGRIKSLFGSQLEKASIVLNIESKPDIWLRADPYQMEQVLINLIRNAAESIGHNGSISIRVKMATARLNGRSQPMVTIEVIDTGKGMSAEIQKHIFDPFFTTKEEGTGLGLGIASRIVEKHGGTLECQSQPNRGTTFTILLPSVKPEQINEPTA